MLLLLGYCSSCETRPYPTKVGLIELNIDSGHSPIKQDGSLVGGKSKEEVMMFSRCCWRLRATYVWYVHKPFVGGDPIFRVELVEETNHCNEREGRGSMVGGNRTHQQG